MTLRDFWRLAALSSACAAVLGACGKPAPNAAAAANAAPTPANVAAAPAPPALSAGDAADAKAFLEGLYAHYKSSKNNTFQMFDKNVREVFDADMIKLLDADSKALKGDLGVIDGDWLCACQDFESIKATIAVQSATPTAAKATSSFVDTGIPSQGARSASFDLVKENGVWRIHDITDQGEASLRTQLEDEIKTLGKDVGKHSPDEAP